VVTSRISRSTGAQSFEGAHRGRGCVRVFIGVSVVSVYMCEWPMACVQPIVAHV
jgi:hypothetical protein